jgi:hypothetical protein
MDAPISVDDVKGAIPRPLTPDEQRVIPAWIDQAWGLLLENVARLEQRLELPDTAIDHVTERTVKSVLLTIVERKVNNATGARAFTLADGTAITNDHSLAAGKIYLAPEELERFRPVEPPAGAMYSVPLGL